jgi:hypothetical protein
MISIMLILLSITLTSGMYVYQVVAGCAQNQELCYDLHQAIMNHTAPSPYRYRIFAPAIGQMLAPDLSDAGIQTGYVIFHLFAFALIYSGLYLWLRRWMNEDRALLGVFIMAILFAFAFRHYLLSPWASLEILLVCWSLLCLSYMPRSPRSPR